MAEDIEKNLETVPEKTDVKAEEISEKKPEKKAGKRVARVALVLALLFLSGVVLYLADLLLRPKYMGDVTEGALTAEYYEAYGDHDVLFVGDCEVYENFSTVQLWKEFGINSFIRGGAQQLVWQSYYLLEDALRYETPDVVVFNVLSLMYNEPQNVFNASACGNNCAKWILKIAEKKDITVNLRHIMDFGDGEFDINILNKNQIVHSMRELVPIAGLYV